MAKISPERMQEIERMIAAERSEATARSIVGKYFSGTGTGVDQDTRPSTKSTADDDEAFDPTEVVFVCNVDGNDKKGNLTDPLD